ncbi:MAG: hypothetical protein ACXWSC_10775, partial [Bdellovibrionota bacterium]
MSDKIKNTIVVLEPCTKSAKELLALVEEKSLAEVVRVNSAEEVIQTLAASLPCMLVTCINDNQDVPTRIQLFKRLESSIKHQGLKVFVVTPLKNRQLADMVTQKMGVADYIVEPIPVRTMQFKANLQLKAVDNFRRQQELKKAAEEKIVIKKLDNAKKNDVPAGNEVKTNAKPALQAGEDTFLFKNSGVKKAGKKFTVELEGPAPETGEWVPHEDKGDAQTSWRWVPNEEKEKQAAGELPPDGWVHKGDKPQFNDNSQKWAMSSETPSLSLQAKGKAVAQKMGVDETGEVFVAEDSPAAEENLQKNRAKAALLKPKKDSEKKSIKDLLAGTEDEAKQPLSVESINPGQEKTAGAKTANRTGKNDGKIDALKALLEGGEEETGVAGILNDQRELNADEITAVMTDKRSREKEKAAVFNGLKEAIAEEEEAEAAEKAGATLDFLKKKKDLQKKESAPIDDVLAGMNPLKSGKEAPAKERLAKKAKKDTSAEDALARLTRSLNEDDAETGNDPLADIFGADGEESGADEDTTGAKGRPQLKLGGGLAKKKAGALRSDPADKRGELRDRQGEGAAEKLASLRKERTRAMGDIQALLDSPLPDKLSAEEEQEIREELGLQGRPEIQPKDLIRKKRLKNAQELKDRLRELDSELSSAEEEASGEVISAGLRAEIKENTPGRTGDLSRDKLNGIRGAFDSADEAEAALEEERKRHKLKLEERKNKIGHKDKAFYMPQAELTPLGNAWDSAGSHYVYLNAKVRYKGFDKLEDLVPLWIFEGEDVPQLLDKTKQWRFLGGQPTQAKTVAEIPKPVRDFLVGLRDQLARGETGADEGEASGEESSAALDKDVKGGKKKATKESSRLRDLGKSIDELLGDDEEAEAPSGFEEESDSGPESRAEDFSDDLTSEDGKKKETEELSGKKSRKKAGDSAGDKLQSLLGDDESGEEEDGGEADSEITGSATGRKREPAQEADPMARLRAKLGMDEDEDADEAASEA